MNEDEDELRAKLDQIIDQTAGRLSIDPAALRQGSGWAQTLPVLNSGIGPMIMVVVAGDGIDLTIRDERGFTLWRIRLKCTGSADS